MVKMSTINLEKEEEHISHHVENCTVCIGDISSGKLKVYRRVV